MSVSQLNSLVEILEGRQLVQQLRGCLGRPPTVSECLGLSSNSASDSGFVVTHILGGARDGQGIWIPATHVGDPD